MAYNRVNHNFLINGYLLDNTTEESIDISSYILEVLIKKSYFEQSFPLFVINLRTTEEMRDRMRDHEVSVNLRISYINAEDETETDNPDTDEHTEVGVYYEGTIRIYDKPFTTTVRKVEEDSESESTQSESAPFVYYTLSGIPEKLISKNEICFNNVYCDCVPGDAVINMLSTIDNNLYIEEPDNKNEYTNIIVPPLNIVPAVEFIDRNYLIYNKGCSLFFDTDKTYLYSPLSFNHESNIIECEITDTEITTSSDTNMYPLVDEKGNMKLRYKTTPNYQTKKYIAQHNLGSKTILYFYDENMNITYQNNSNPDAYSKVRYIWGPMYDDRISLLNYSETLSLSFTNMNPGLINPLSTVRIISEKYPAANGDYAVSEVRIGFTSGNANLYKDSIAIGLIKKI